MRAALLMLLAVATRSVRAVRLPPTRAALVGRGRAPAAAVRAMCTPIPTVDPETGEPLSKSAIKKLQKQAAIAAKKAAKKAEKAAAGGGADAAAGGGGGGGGAPAAEEPAAAYSFTDVGVVQSVPGLRAGRAYAPIATLGAAGGPAAGDEVWVRGRLYRIRAKGNQCFLVLRAGALHTVQAVFFKQKETPTQSKAMLNALGELTEESVVDIRGSLVEAKVDGCSVSTLELAIEAVELVSSAEPKLPFELDDAARSEAEIDASEGTDRPLPRLGQDLRLNNRWIDLRVPANLAIMKVQSEVCALFRDSLRSQGFVEIHTPKLIAGESEGGADVFRTDYFGEPACLAQSPQLYKQMVRNRRPQTHATHRATADHVPRATPLQAIAADLDRVFEIGPVFRAENSNTRRHLCEFTGLDMEMAFTQHYDEVIGVLHNMFVAVFEGLEENLADDLAAVRAQYPSAAPRTTAAPCVVHWEEAMEMLEAAEGVDAPGFDDLSTAQERALGELVAEKYGTDFYFLDRFPSAVRPFYTMPCADDGRYSNSYDIFLRGEEICSGAQRVHVPEMLEAAVVAKTGKVDAGLRPYIDSMRHGMPPHGGAGIGLERLVFLYLNLDNVRKASMFPRTPGRCAP